jgi:hypothetical protein
VLQRRSYSLCLYKSTHFTSANVQILTPEVLQRISSLLVHESKEKEKATREVHQANQLLTDRQQQATFIYVCVCVCVHIYIYICVCVCVRERERERVYTH